VLADCPVLALVALTVIWNVPAGVPVCLKLPPPQPTKVISTRRPANSIAKRKRADLPFFLPTPKPSRPKIGSNAAYKGGVIPGACAVTGAEPALAETVIVTVAEIWLSD